MNRTWMAILMALSLGLCPAAPVFAESGPGHCDVCTRTQSDDWGVKTGSQLTRGVLNTGLCWTEMGRQPARELESGGNLLIGLGKGIGHSLLRLLRGTAEILTAPMPHAEDGSQIASDCAMCMWQA